MVLVISPFWYIELGLTQLCGLNLKWVSIVPWIIIKKKFKQQNYSITMICNFKLYLIKIRIILCRYHQVAYHHYKKLTSFTRCLLMLMWNMISILCNKAANYHLDVSQNKIYDVNVIFTFITMRIIKILYYLYCMYIRCAVYIIRCVVNITYYAFFLINVLYI